MRHCQAPAPLTPAARQHHCAQAQRWTHSFQPPCTCLHPSAWQPAPCSAPRAARPSLPARQRTAALGQRLLRVAQAVEVQVRVGAVPLHGDDLQVAAKVARVEARDGQAVAVPRQHHGAAALRGRVQRLHLHRLLGGGVEVGPDGGHAGARDAAALVAHLDRHVLAALRHHQPDGRRLHVVVLVLVLHRAQAVLDQLKHHVVQVRGHVGEGKLGVAVHRDLGRRAVLAQADGARVVDGVLRHLDW
mmetsp:Transcript_3475/g.8665  ORF Transcript_3475/g.8665 Transcript_3475/m.8665 type:complete len:245 (-) Transcript_3475:748-1482(-)